GKHAYLLWDKDVTYTILLADYFKTRFTASGGTLVLEDQYDDKATDFSAQIARVKALPQQPDFYFISAMPYNGGPVVKQFRAAGVTGPIMGGDGYDNPGPRQRRGRGVEQRVFYDARLDGRAARYGWDQAIYRSV